MVFLFGSEQEYKLLPSPLITRAIDWVAVRADGGVEVSSAAAARFLFGRAISANIRAEISRLGIISFVEKIRNWCCLLSVNSKRLGKFYIAGKLCRERARRGLASNELASSFCLFEAYSSNMMPILRTLRQSFSGRVNKSNCFEILLWCQQYSVPLYL